MNYTFHSFAAKQTFTEQFEIEQGTFAQVPQLEIECYRFVQTISKLHDLLQLKPNIPNDLGVFILFKEQL